MKKSIMFLFLLTMFHMGTFGQEATTPEAKESGYRSHSIGITQRFGGGQVWAKGLGVNYHQALSLTTFDFYTEKRKGKGKYSPLVQLRITAPLGKLSFTSRENSIFSENMDRLVVDTYGPFISGFSAGFLFGGSHYLFDKRSKETGKGWSMLLNGGFIINIYTLEWMDYMMQKSPISFGGEISFKPVYNFSKNVAITFGFDIGYEAAFSQDLYIDFEDYFSGRPSMGDMFQHALTYGFSVGLLF